MRRTSLKPSPSGLPNTPWRINLPADISESGKRERHFFKTKAEAQTFAGQQRTQIQNFGRNASSLSPGQLEEASMAFEKLAPLGVSLNTVIVEYMARHDLATRSKTFAVMFTEFMAVKSTDKMGKKRSPAYLRGLKYTLPRFPGLHDKLVCNITPKQIDAATDGMTGAARNAFLRNIRAAFNFGIKQKWATANPVEDVEFTKLKKKPVQKLTPAQVIALMEAAEAQPDLLPYHALGLFAGIRPYELQLLSWEQINVADRHIEILPEVSKTEKRRIVEMEPNLRAWITRYVQLGGTMKGKVTPLKALRDRLRELREAAGVTKWVQDIMRHSYASYHLAHFQKIDPLTLNMGHEDPEMLFEFYNAAATKKDAAAFWKIKPAGKLSSKIIPMSAAA